MIGRIAMAFLALSLSPRSQAAPTDGGYHVVKRFPVGGEGGWDCLTVDSANRRLYISRSTRVMVLNIDTGAPVGEIADTPGVHDIAIAPNLNKGFTSNGGDNSVTIFDLKSLKPLGRVSVGERPDVILYDPATRRVFTMNAGGGSATAIDGADGKVAGTVELGGKPEFAVSDTKGHLYVNLEDKSEIAQVDSRKLEVTAHWSIAPGDGPSGLAIDTAHHRLFAVCGNEKMIVVDAKTGKVLAAPTIGRGPDGAQFDTKSGLAFSSNGQDGTLTVVRAGAAARFDVVENALTETGARTMALDTKTGNVILVTAKTQPGAGGGRRRSYEPGSFVVLVVGK